jgi:hypothetical protein
VGNRRWAGVPFYLRTGKRLGRRVTEVAVSFKRAPHLPFNEHATEGLGHNALVMRIQPDEGVTLRFGAKVPGTAMELRDVNMDFAYGGAFVESSPEAYERLILDVLLGDPPLFPQHEEVELSWKILDPVIKHWAAERTRAVRLRRLGTASADEMLARDGRAWRDRTRPEFCDEGRPDRQPTPARSPARTRRARRAAGSPAMGMVMTLVLVTDEQRSAATMKAARQVAAEHPARSSASSTDAKGAPRLDATVQVGQSTSGASVKLRMSVEA